MSDNDAEAGRTDPIAAALDGYESLILEMEDLFGAGWGIARLRGNKDPDVAKLDAARAALSTRPALPAEDEVDEL